MKKFAWFLLCGILCLSLGHFPAQAQSAIQVSQDRIVLDIPENITFQLSAASSTEIQSVELRYGTALRSCQDSIAARRMDFQPGQSVELEWRLEFEQMGALLPGQRLWWQWTVRDAAGNTLTTPRQEQTLQDQRYEWQSTTNGPVTVEWIEGNRSFGQQLATLAANALKKLQRDTGAPGLGPYLLVIYPDDTSLREALVQSSQWAGGVAITGENLILLGIAPEWMDWAEEAVPHEMTHLIVDDLTFNCEGVRPPTWLEEGLAMHTEGPLTSFERNDVLQALENDTLDPLTTKEDYFSAYGEEANRDYVYSQMIVDYLYAEYGAGKMAELLKAFQDGMDTEPALRSVYGLDTAGIDAAWRLSLGFTPPTAAPTRSATRTPIPTLALWTAVPRLTATSTPGALVAATQPVNAEPSPTAGATQLVAVEPSPTQERVAQSGDTAPTPSPEATAANPISRKLCGALLPVLLLAALAFKRNYLYG